MGLWSWILDRLTEDGSGDSTAQVRAESEQALKDGETAAVATLEREEESAKPDEGETPQIWWRPEGATLLEPPEVTHPDLPLEARALENLLVSHFDGHDLSMPPLLHIAERVLGRLRDPKCCMSSVADEIAEDQVVAAAVFRMTNSPLYRGVQEITALQPAVTRLGARAIQTLMMHESLRAAYFQGKGWSAGLARLLWERSLAGACIMRALCKFTGVAEEDAYLIGLLHDIGGVIVLRIVHDNSKFTNYEPDLETFDFLCSECHQEFGELVADSWQLPSYLKELISGHHVYPEPDDDLRTQRLQLQLTDMIVAMLGYTQYFAYDLPNSRAVRDLGLMDRSGFTAFLDGLPEYVEETIEAL
ncbi:MAG: HDOD domain-containing protein [Phycisphaerales bacterium]|nr:MAG: HDOD domain-containing protein [Phycisphaerales bacterium]